MRSDEAATLVAGKTLCVALAGNPNSGKTSVFNHLTGARQHVANYPGVTVETKHGRFRHRGRSVRVVDLPGTYSLTAYSVEELVARNYLIERRPDVVVDVIDASNLERNLYLAIQLLELGVRLVLALNMSDLAEGRGLRIDLASLSRALKCPIVATVGHRGCGIAALKEAAVAASRTEPPGPPAGLHYGQAAERELEYLCRLLETEPSLTGYAPDRWLALKLLESDEQVRSTVAERAADPDPLLHAAEAAIARIEQQTGETPDVVLAQCRYRFISEICSQAVTVTAPARSRLSDRVDSVVTHRWFGIPIFLVMMFMVFKLTFTLGAPAMEAIDRLFGWLSGAVDALDVGGADSALESLLVDGVIGGVGGVLVFVPNIVLLFLAISLLEDSGYMARAAFIMDRLMHKIGLHGKSFIPMLIGFGCTVPAIMATRTLESRRDRLTTMLVLPLMSCGARLPIYTLFIPAFFPPAWQAPVLWSLYLVGIVLAVVLAKLLRCTLFRGEAAPFVMELPPYRLPTLRSTVGHVWERTGHFVRKAGTIILSISVLLWAMATWPKPPAARLRGLPENQVHSLRLAWSLSGRLGRAIEPAMRPIGFDWKTSTAMVGALAAKEVVVAQLGIVHALGEVEGESEPLRSALQREYSPLQAYCIMLFCLISLPCMATLATTWKESGAWYWAVVQLATLTAIAYVLTLAVYQVGGVLGVGTG